MSGTGEDQDVATRRAANLDAVRRAFAAVSRGDVDGQLAEYVDDAVMEFPFADPPGALQGKAAIEGMLRPALAVIKMQLEITAIYECVDPDRAVVEFRSQGSVATTGKPYANRYVGVFEFVDGKIRMQREYLNPTPYLEAMRQS